MRILLTTDPIGGVWTFTKDLVSELLVRGHEVALISFGRDLSPSQLAWCASVSATYGDSVRFEISTVALEWMRDNSRVYRDAVKPLLGLVQQFNPDIIHTNQFCFGYLPVGTPVIVTAHSDVLSWAEACEPQGLPSSSWLERYMLLVWRGLEAASAITAPSHWMLNALRRNYKFTAPTCTIPNGRTLPVAPILGRPVQAVSIGRMWDKAKNLALLAELQANVPITIVGENSYDGLDAPNAPGHFNVVGPMKEEEILALLCQSSCYLVPSVYEPFGLAALEAALCGCAVLAHNIPSLREVWGDAALYFQSAEELGVLLQHLESHKNVLLSARVRAQHRARQFTAGKMAEGYLSLYKTVLRQSILGEVSGERAYAG